MCPMSPHGPTAPRGAIQAGGHGQPGRQVSPGLRPAAVPPLSPFETATLMLPLL